MNDIVESLCRKVAGAAYLGRAPAFLEAVRDLPRIAEDAAAVLIEGETGTGKEMAARALHYRGPRFAGPFVAVNCGALPETLLENELFGHEKGAFTDARDRREGLIAQAEGGTLFLDEIDSLPRKAQVSLLRVLQEGRYRPVGAAAERTADVRVVAAANVPLEPLVQTGAFRTDLYFRLCVFRLCLPPLRRRLEDLALLAAHFLQKHSAESHAPPVLSAAALAALAAYDWPGNVRELENAMIRGARLCEGGRIEPKDLGLRAKGAAREEALGSFQVLKRAAIRDFEQDYLRRLITAHHGNVTQAAHASGQDRRRLGKLLQKHHLDPRSFIAPAPEA